MNLKDLSLPFPQEDIKWRVSRSGMGKNGIYCNVFAYVTARAIQSRLDDVCGPENWKNEYPRTIELRPGVVAFSGGISIRIGDEWVTKWDVAEPTNIESAKGGFSGSQKRAGTQWGIGRYLYYLKEVFAEVSDQGGKGWNHAKLGKDQGGIPYYWKTPTLPSWALPKEPEHEISVEELNKLKREWKEKFAENIKASKDLREGFSRFVISSVGEFPISDNTCWTRIALDKCKERIANTNNVNGPDSDIPFDK